MATIESSNITNRLVRVAGRDLPARLVLQAAIRERHAPVTLRSPLEDNDYALIDPSLAVESTDDELGDMHVVSGTSFAGMTPAQRAAFMRWLQAPNRPGPRAFQDLYLAQLEVRLFEGGSVAENSALVLRSMQTQSTWQGIDGVARATLLSYWLQQDGIGLRTWLTHTHITPDLLTLSLGLQALLETPMSATELAKIGSIWQLPALLASEPVLKVRLASLATTLGGDPLQVALENLSDEAILPRPWRANHRGLRLSLPQPPLRRSLERLLADLDVVVGELDNSEPTQASKASAAVIENGDVDDSVDDSDDTHSDIGGDADGTIVLEFGESRSEYFDYVLHLAQQIDGYSQLMDEDRRLIYRVHFRKSKLRKFWRIWEYVQNWSSTCVYVDGEEIERWKVWPYSQFLR